jgi:hypothetical protein
LRNLEFRGGIAHFNAHSGFFRGLQPECGEQVERELAVAAGIDDQVRGNILHLAIGMETGNARDSGSILGGDQLLGTAALDGLDVAHRREVLSHHRFKQRSRHAIRFEAKITLRKGLIARKLPLSVQGHREQPRPSSREALLKPGEK